MKVLGQKASVLAVALLGALVMTGTWSSRLTTATAGNVDEIYGAFGPEGPRLREQLWILPSGDPKLPLRATLFRPSEADAGAQALTVSTRMTEPGPRRPLVIINHGTDARTREAASMPVFYWLSRWFVDRGFVVVVPQRRGHGATGGDLAEAFDSCLAPDHLKAGQIAADDLEAVLEFMRDQPFVDGNRIYSVGISSGGWASLALAARNPVGLAGVINFAGGRGGHAGGVPGAVCGRDKLVRAAGELGRSSRVPTLWLYSANDTYFGPDLARAMSRAWLGAGGAARLHVLAPYGQDGHSLADDKAGWRLWGSMLSEFIGERGGTVVHTRSASAQSANADH